MLGLSVGIGLLDENQSKIGISLSLSVSLSKLQKGKILLPFFLSPSLPFFMVCLEKLRICE